MESVTKPNTQSIYDMIGSIAESLHKEYGIPLEKLQGLLKVVATILNSISRAWPWLWFFQK